MRQILFRAKTRKGVWEYGTPAFNDTLSDLVEIRHNHNGTGTLALRNTLGQFTGRKDINGKDIFEGDIVKFKRCGAFEGKYEDYLGEVRYDENSA